MQLRCRSNEYLAIILKVFWCMGKEKRVRDGNRGCWKERH